MNNVQPEQPVTSPGELNLTFDEEARATVLSPMSGPLTSDEWNRMSLLDKGVYLSRGLAVVAGVPLFGVALKLKASQLTSSADAIFMWIFDNTNLPTELVWDRPPGIHDGGRPARDRAPAVGVADATLAVGG